MSPSCPIFHVPIPKHRSLIAFLHFTSVPRNAPSPSNPPALCHFVDPRSSSHPPEVPSRSPVVSLRPRNMQGYSGFNTATTGGPERNLRYVAALDREIPQIIGSEMILASQAFRKETWCFESALRGSLPSLSNSSSQENAPQRAIRRTWTGKWWRGPELRRIVEGRWKASKH